MGGGYRWLVWVGVGLLVVSLAGVAWLSSRSGNSQVTLLGWEHRLDAPLEPPVAARPTESELALMFGELWMGRVREEGPRSPLWRTPNQGVYVSGRFQGTRRAHVWDVGGGTVREALSRALSALREHGGDDSDAIETFLVTERLYLDPANPLDVAELVATAHRGVRGLEVQWRDALRIYSPTFLLATNRSPADQLEIVRRELGASGTDFEVGGEYYSLFGPQYLITPDGDLAGWKAIEMQRGNVTVPLSDVTAETTRRMAELASAWMARSLQADGRFPYMIYPSTGGESSGNNMIRQWMASHALVKAAARTGDAEDWALATRNIDFNLANFYHEVQDGGATLGLIDERGKVKLGAVALAALVLAEHRERERWRSQYLALNRTVEHLWNDDGRFDTFYRKPATTKEQPNYYPGEALLMWVDRYEREPDPLLLERIMQSFRFYRAWHLRPVNRNPAFVPWHVRAYSRLWRQTRDPELAAFVFEMSDWLLTMQEWTPLYAEFVGRFHDPIRPQFGPPHASATGVYLEGYVEAYRLAVALAERTRVERYRKAIVGGLRSLMQLQFVDDVDLYYVADRDAVRGAMRTTVYDNEVRCDNVQHGLMAMFEILEHFQERDYRLN